MHIHTQNPDSTNSTLFTLNDQDIFELRNRVIAVYQSTSAVSGIVLLLYNTYT